MSTYLKCSLRMNHLVFLSDIFKRISTYFHSCALTRSIISRLAFKQMSQETVFRSRGKYLGAQELLTLSTQSSFLSLFLCLDVYHFIVFQYKRLQAPFKTNCSKVDSLAGIKSYTKDGCIYQCQSNQSMDKCGCQKNHALPGGIKDKCCAFTNELEFRIVLNYIWIPMCYRLGSFGQDMIQVFFQNFCKIAWTVKNVPYDIRYCTTKSPVQATNLSLF